MSFEITTSNGVFFIPARTIFQARSMAFLRHGIRAEEIKDWRYVTRASLAAKKLIQGHDHKASNPPTELNLKEKWSHIAEMEWKKRGKGKAKK